MSKTTLEDVLFEIEAPGDGVLLHREIPLAVTVSFALAGRMGRQGKEVPRFLGDLSQV